MKRIEMLKQFHNGDHPDNELIFVKNKGKDLIDLSTFFIIQLD